jgi:hypothetical protein
MTTALGRCSANRRQGMHGWAVCRASPSYLHRILRDNCRDGTLRRSIPSAELPCGSYFSGSRTPLILVSRDTITYCYSSTSLTAPRLATSKPSAGLDLTLANRNLCCHLLHRHPDISDTVSGLPVESLTSRRTLTSRRALISPPRYGS